MALILATAAAVALAAKRFRDGDRIADNVSIEGVPVGGLTASEARQRVLTDWSTKLPRHVRLRWQHGSHLALRDDLGVQLDVDAAVAQAQRFGREGGLLSQLATHLRLRHAGANVPVTVTVNTTPLEAYLRKLAQRVNRPPRNAEIDVIGDRVHVIPGQPGTQLDLPASLAQLHRVLQDPHATHADLFTRPREPLIKASDLQQIEIVLATFTTRFRSSQENRTHNLALAIQKLSEAVLMPGDTLSFNQRVGPRLAKYGFKDAPIFVNGQIEPSTGGGVCQVASTVYNAALLANLDIVERHHHSRPVDYVPSGRDATVYWGQCDLRIRNNLAHPVLFVGSINGGAITVKVLGHREDDYDVEIERSGIATIKHDVREEPDPTLPLGQRKTVTRGRDGTRVTVVRIVRKNGKLVRKQQLHQDVYSPQAAVVRVGTKPPAPSPEPLPPPLMPEIPDVPLGPEQVL